MHSKQRVYVAGHRGLVGSAIVRCLEKEGYENLILAGRDRVDLRDRSSVDRFFSEEQPEFVFVAAAKVGGIHANNTYPAEFLYENLLIETNVIDAAYRSGVKKLLFLGSSCIYPKLAPQPLREEYLLSGSLEPTNEWYAIAKIAGMKLVEAYRKQYGFNGISLMPTNLYGPGDNFDLQNSHVLPALIRKLDDAQREGRKEVQVWGTGTPRREFLHVDDLADACLFAMRNYEGEQFLNTGTGEDVTIRELAELIAKVVGFEGNLVFDTTKPDGTPRKLLDVSRFHALGWKARIPLEQGIRETYKWYVDQVRAGAELRGAHALSH